MNVRETFDEIRNRKKEHFTLNIRMVLIVQLELLACVGLAFLIDMLVRAIKPDWNFPIILEIIIVSIMVGGVATAFVSKLFFNPIKKLRRAMDKVADGDFSVRLDPDESASGEIQELYAGFNLMTHELSTTEVLQTDFVSNVSHEFKTPINAIEGYATLLQDYENLTEQDKDEYINKILFNTRRLSNLVGNILLLSKIDNQAITPKKALYRLDEQIRQAILLLEPEWIKKDIEFDVEMDDVNYNGYENLMHHVWYNLIGNAIKFNPSGGMIRIRLSKKEGKVIFTIEDNGPGISEEAKKHIFDKFYQEDTSHKQEGNGLGLALVKNIINLEQGEIKAENIVGGGCRFTITLSE